MLYENIKKIMTMKELKSVAWKVSGDDKFKPEKTEVLFEDVEGTQFALVIHKPDAWTRKLRNEEEVILNVAFTHFGIIPSGHWIGVNVDIEKMVNLCRKKAKYEGVFFVNEDRCSWNDFETPIHIF